MSSNLYERRDLTDEIPLSEAGKEYMRRNPKAVFALERVVREGFASVADFNADRRRNPEKYPDWLRLDPGAPAAAPGAEPGSRT